MKFKIYASCVVIKGYTRAVLMDFDKNHYYLIPLDLADLIEKYEGNTIESITNDHPKYHQIIDEYFDFLVKNRLIFFTEEPQHFKKIDWIYKSPSNITNAVIEIDTISIQKWSMIIAQLEHENCKAIELFFTKKIKFENLKNLLDLTSESLINSINLTFLYQANLTEEILNQIYHTYPEIHLINLYSSPFDKQVLLDNMELKPVFYTKDKLVLSEGGYIYKENFVVNRLFFSESLNFNTYHNRKIAIDIDGNIKNCPAMKRNFGNIENTTLSEAIEKDGFKKYWYIKKDEIDVCQDCEFRHVCSDSRSFTVDPSNIYSRPSKCNFNPYIGLWKGQDKWQSVSKWRKSNPNWKEKAQINRSVIAKG